MGFGNYLTYNSRFTTSFCRKIFCMVTSQVLKFITADIPGHSRGTGCVPGAQALQPGNVPRVPLLPGAATDERRDRCMAGLRILKTVLKRNKTCHLHGKLKLFLYSPSLHPSPQTYQPKCVGMQQKTARRDTKMGQIDRYPPKKGPSFSRCL